MKTYKHGKIWRAEKERVKRIKRIKNPAGVKEN